MEMFRHLKVYLPPHSHSTLSTTIDADGIIQHDPDICAPNTALAIFRSREAAGRAIQVGRVSCAVSRAAAAGKTVKEEEEEEDEVGEGEEEPEKEEKEAEEEGLDLNLNLTITPSTTNHPLSISRGHYASSFSLETRSIMGQDLEDRVPVPGFADLRWHKGEVPLRVRNVRAEEEKREGRGWWKVGLGDVWRGGVERRVVRDEVGRERREKQKKEREIREGRGREDGAKMRGVENQN